jgi:lipoprotein signal peptidase
MDIFRYGHDAWGQSVINGVSWSLLDVAVGVGVAVIVIHFIFRTFNRKRRS